MSRAVSEDATNPPPPAISRIRQVLLEQSRRNVAHVPSLPPNLLLPDFGPASRPERSELIEALKAVRIMLYEAGSDLTRDGWERLRYLRMAHRLDRLLLRHRG